MATASLNRQQIAYDDTGGDGPPVVLAHGFLMDRSMFDPQVDALRDRYGSSPGTSAVWARRLTTGDRSPTGTWPPTASPCSTI